jgi:hypothetical protein
MNVPVTARAVFESSSPFATASDAAASAAIPIAARASVRFMQFLLLDGPRDHVAARPVQRKLPVKQR